MTWMSEQASGNCITYADWNTMVQYIKYGFQSGANNWNSASYCNSGLVWDCTLKKWKAMKSGGLNIQTTNALYLKSTSSFVTNWTDLTDGGQTSLHYHAGGGGGTTGYYWSTQANKSAGSIYYRGGEVVIAPSGTDYGTYRLQVSGASYFSGSVQFIGELSGLADPTYASGAANKHYVEHPVFISTQAISGSWRTPLYRGKPTAAAGNCGCIIRTSGSTGEKTYVWVSVKNDADTYEWLQLAMST